MYTIRPLQQTHIEHTHTHTQEKYTENKNRLRTITAFKKVSQLFFFYIVFFFYNFRSFFFFFVLEGFFFSDCQLGFCVRSHICVFLF